MSKYIWYTCFEHSQMSLGLLPSFFLKSRSVVLDCGHSPGQHAQHHRAPTKHILVFISYGAMWRRHTCEYGQKLSGLNSLGGKANPRRCYLLTIWLQLSSHDTVPERLRGWIRNPLGSARRGSNPIGVDECRFCVALILCSCTPSRSS